MATVGGFIGRAELATAVHEWTPSEAEAYPGDPPSGVLLSDVEEWDPALPMGSVVARIDPTASNPLVQANAAAGFRTGVVRIRVVSLVRLTDEGARAIDTFGRSTPSGDRRTGP